MAKEPKNKPELHQPVMDTIANIYTAHTSGGGELSLEDTVRLFAPDLTAADAALLTVRGNIQIVPIDATTGTFINKGKEVKVNRSGVTVTIPAQLSGNYASSPDAFRLAFHPQYSIEGGMLFIKAKLEAIAADTRTLTVNLSNDSFDQYIVHAP